MAKQKKTYSAHFPFRRFFGLVVVAIACMTLTVSLFWIGHKDAQARLKWYFESDASMRTHLVIDELNHLKSHIEMLRRYSESMEDIDRAGFKDFVAPILAEGYKGQTLEWVPRVAGDSRTIYERKARNDGLVGFQFTELDKNGDLIPASHRQVYYPAYYVEPVTGNEKALGFDQGSNPARLAALEMACDSGKPTATGHMTLLQRTKGQFGFLVYEPVYREEMPTSTVKQRRAALVGFMVGVFRTGEVMKGAIGPTTPVDMPTDLLDTSAPEDKRLLHHWSSRLSTEHEHQTLWFLYPAPPQYSHSFAFAGRVFQVVVKAGPIYLGRHYQLGHWLIIPAGLLLTVMLTLYLRSLLTQRERAEVLVQERTAELLVREQQFRSLFEQSKEGLVITDLSGKILDTNQAYRDMTGYSPDELENISLQDITPEKWHQMEGDIVENQILKRGYSEVYEKEYIHKDGSVFPIEIRTWLIRDAKWKATGLSAWVQDITERKRMEQELRQERERLKTLLENMPLASSYTDDAGNIEFINHVFIDLFGYTIQDIPTIEDWFQHAYPDPEYREEVMARWNADATRAKVEETKIGPGEYHITCKDGSVRTCEITGTFLDKGLMLVFNDITERIHAEEAIRQSEERFRVQFKGIPVPTYIWKYQDGEFFLIDYNDAALDFTKGRIASFKDVSASGFYEGKSWIIDDMQRCITKRINLKNEFWDTLRTTGEKKYMAVRYAFVPPNLVMVHMEDITRQKEVEEHLRYLSIHDPLTGLYNRFYADTEIERLKTSRKYPVSIMVVDIDGLKALNDSEGHAAGDQLIKDAAYILKQAFRPDDMVARIGGDEFLVILPLVDVKILEKSLKRLEVYLANFNASGPGTPVSFSVGATTAHNDEELETCIKQADMLMYRDKAQKKSLQQGQA
jgi:diguanylate cyclase (GGDEF)-like protein/PAS domain S-box-containing protein